jgi:hypothetical protein
MKWFEANKTGFSRALEKLGFVAPKIVIARSRGSVAGAGDAPETGIPDSGFDITA